MRMNSDSEATGMKSVKSLNYSVHFKQKFVCPRVWNPTIKFLRKSPHLTLVLQKTEFNHPKTPLLQKLPYSTHLSYAQDVITEIIYLDYSPFQRQL